MHVLGFCATEASEVLRNNSAVLWKPLFSDLFLYPDQHKGFQDNIITETACRTV